MKRIIENPILYCGCMGANCSRSSKSIFSSSSADRYKKNHPFGIFFLCGRPITAHGAQITRCAPNSAGKPHAASLSAHFCGNDFFTSIPRFSSHTRDERCYLSASAEPLLDKGGCLSSRAHNTCSRPVRRLKAAIAARAFLALRATQITIFFSLPLWRRGSRSALDYIVPRRTCAHAYHVLCAKRRPTHRPA
jgi:hypothetical protein